MRLFMQTKSKYYVYSLIILALVVISIFFYYQTYSFDALYAFHSTDLNVSGLCSSGEPSLIIYYANNCRTCTSTLDSFENVTSLFGLWSNNTFYGGYFCAWDFNISAYNQNSTSYNVPDAAISLFNQIPGDRVPLIIFNGKYYKVGGFTNNQTAYQDILKYVCLSINESAPQCS